MGAALILVAVQTPLTLEARLEQLDGQDARVYVELGEDLAEAPEQYRDVARVVLVHAVELGVGQTRRTALWTLHALARTAGEQAFLEARLGAVAAGSGPSGFLPVSGRPGVTPLDPTAILAADALGHLAAGRPARAREILADPEAMAVLERIESVLPGGMDAVHLEVAAGRLEPVEFDGRMPARVHLLGVVDRPWAAIILSGRTEPYVPASLELVQYYGVDPARRLWRGGRWVVGE